MKIEFTQQPLAVHTVPPLEQISRPNITTSEAAFYLNRRPQTLRCWAMREDGLIRPLRINGRLAWPVAQIRALLSGGAK